jgi:outer membrane lipoprotein SlyB
MTHSERFMLIAALTALVGCAAPEASNKVYGRSALSSATRTIEAQVVSKRMVQVDGSQGTGSAAGGALGAIGGSSLGGNSRDGLAGAVVGAVIGSAIGAAAEANAKKIDAYEYIVKSDVTGLLTIIQSDGDIEVGQKVYVILGARPVIVKSNR